MLGVLPLADGRPWGAVATDWQRADAEAVLDVAGPAMHWLGRPRGGAKTSDAAAIAVAAHVAQAPPGARSYAVAADADQAGLLLDSVRGMLLYRPVLRSIMRVEARRVVFLRDGEAVSTLDVVPADEASAYGLRPWLLIADELAVWPSTSGAKGLWAAMVSALPKVPGSRLVVLTSAGSPDHWSHKVLEKARTRRRWRVSEIPGPVSWIDAEALDEQRSLLTESQFERLHLNRWVAAEDRLTTPEQVRACVGHWGPLEPVVGRSYVLGLDVGLTSDRTALTVAHHEVRPPGATVVVDRQWVWEGSKANPVQLAEVEEVAYQASRSYFGAPLVADPYQAVMLCQHLRRRNVRVREFTFSSGSVGRLALTLYRLLRDGALDLDGDDEELLTELCRVRLVERQPGVYRIDHASGEHDDRVISCALAANALVERGAPAPGSVTSAARTRMPATTLSRTSPSTRSGAIRLGKFTIPEHLAGQYRPPGDGWR
jgi:hypothetical protein